MKSGLLLKVLVATLFSVNAFASSICDDLKKSISITSQQVFPEQLSAGVTEQVSLTIQIEKPERFENFDLIDVRSSYFSELQNQVFGAMTAPKFDDPSSDLPFYVKSTEGPIPPSNKSVVYDLLVPSNVIGLYLPRVEVQAVSFAGQFCAFNLERFPLNKLFIENDPAQSDIMPPIFHYAFFDKSEYSYGDTIRLEVVASDKSSFNLDENPHISLVSENNDSIQIQTFDKFEANPRTGNLVIEFSILDREGWPEIISGSYFLRTVNIYDEHGNGHFILPDALSNTIKISVTR